MRSIYNATITFGLISVPVKLHSATESKTVHFKEVHVSDGAQIEHRRINPESGREIDFEHIVKGYEVAKGEFVVLSKDEVKAAAGERTKEIPVEDFVPAEAIDPVFYEKTYYLGAREPGEDAYKVLHDALEKTGRAGIGRMTYRDKEYLVAIRPIDGVLALHTMRFADAIVGGDDLDVAGSGGRAPSEREVTMASKLVETLHGPFKPKDYEDTYRERVLELIEAKAAGKEIDLPEAAAPEDNDNLMAALEASLSGGKQ